MKTRKPKTNLELSKEIRTLWCLNPVTRVQENEKKNKKKLRRDGKILIKENQKYGT
jgi:hypothetical protein